MPMTLNNVPVPGQSLASSRDLINQNFVTIDAAFQTDHVPYTSSSPLQGKHNRVTFPLQAMAPVFIGSDSGLYSALDSFSAKNQIFIVPPGTSPLTPLTPVPMTAASFTIPGWSYLPSGLLMQWGQDTITGGVTTPIPLPKTFPNGGLIGQITAAGTPVAANISSITTTTLNVVNFNATSSIFWFVIGF